MSSPGPYKLYNRLFAFVAERCLHTIYPCGVHNIIIFNIVTATLSENTIGPNLIQRRGVHSNIYNIKYILHTCLYLGISYIHVDIYV